MSENLIAGLGPGLDIETNTESMILLKFIEDNWTMVNPAAANVDFGAHPSRTTKDVTLNCYRRSTIIRDLVIGQTSYRFNVMVGIDVYSREVQTPGMKDIPPRLMAIETYLRELIALNKLNLRDKGIKSIHLAMVENPPEPGEGKARTGRGGMKWFHSVVSVQCIYSMFAVTT